MSDQHDHETVVVERDGGSAMATILGVIVILALLGAVWYFTLGPGAGRTADEGGTDNQVVPSLEVPGGGGGESAAP